MKGPLLIAALLSATLAACDKPPRYGYPGYVEGEFVYLSAPQPGYLEQLDKLRGSRVAPGDAIFRIGAEPDLQALAAARARQASAASREDNLSAPHRPPEIATLEAQLRAAESALALSSSQLAQQEALAAQQFVSGARLDEYRAARRRDTAAVDAARHQLAEFKATLGRAGEIRAARAELAAAGAEAQRQQWLLARKAGTAPAAGEIADTYFRPGEWVAAGAPVASLLPDAGRRIRFFVPQAEIAALAAGRRVQVRCDGCGEPFAAQIDFIAQEAEYTPPVIYSEHARDKLVFRVEAVPLAFSRQLHPGLPVEVRLEGPR